MVRCCTCLHPFHLFLFRAPGVRLHLYLLLLVNSLLDTVFLRLEAVVDFRHALVYPRLVGNLLSCFIHFDRNGVRDKNIALFKRQREGWWPAHGGELVVSGGREGGDKIHVSHLTLSGVKEHIGAGCYSFSRRGAD